MKSSCNLFMGSILSPNNPIFVRMGSVPVLKSSVNRTRIRFNSFIDPSPDYTFKTSNNVFVSNMKLPNVSTLNVTIRGKVVTNIFIKFEYNNSVFAVTSYNQAYTYTSFGSFAFRVYTKFGGNDLFASRTIINIQKIQYYPFSNFSLNKFQLNCSLNGLNLNCFINLNISNYGQSNQIITLDFNDGSFQDIGVNSYCENYLNI